MLICTIILCQQQPANKMDRQLHAIDSNKPLLSWPSHVKIALEVDTWRVEKLNNIDLSFNIEEMENNEKSMRRNGWYV
jgi:hypothetical protein